MKRVSLGLGVLALSLHMLAPSAAKAQNIRAATPQANYPPESWVFNLQFRRFPWSIDCREENGRGKLTKRGSGGTVTYKLTGFPSADRLLCTVNNDPKRVILIDVDNLFGVGRKKRVMGGEYFEGEVNRVDLKVQYQRNAVGYGSHKAHARRYTVFGKDRIIYADDTMLYGFFPQRRYEQTKKRWKP
ncbi:hypothetical protein [Shimia sp. SDUM112013]|uniref:hypothetical protein n=1 Tax=Shimia sp. SDUM112013 TaxID=3136160 RepID=UPI0032ED26D0